MHDSLTALRSIRPVSYPALRVWQQFRGALPTLLLGLAIGLGSGMRAEAATPDTAPTALTDTLAQIDDAANRRDLRAVMEYFDRDFTHSDGLTRSNLEQALQTLWERYPNLTYQTTLNAWEPIENGFVAETTTTITGTERLGTRTMTLTATIDSRQRIVNQEIVEQEILGERSQLTSGSNPPTLEVNLPETVTIGREFAFDAIVQEPLGDRLLLGTAIEEPVTADGYTNATPVSLELLSAGGLFKLGRAPALPDDRWISAVIVREDGITAVTRRLQVVSQSSVPQPR